MRTITTNVYKFDELSDEARQKAIDNTRDINVDQDWWDYLYEDAELIGLKITGFDLGRSWTIDGDVTESPGEVCQRITREHGKDCDTYKLALDYYQRKHDGDPMTAEDFTYALKQEYLSMLNREYEYLTSDEAAIETIEANGYEYTEDGSMV